ncbi:MAG: cyclic nucleotide-binding domain-containing protein, partial [Vicinamibacteria bacterium]
MTERFRIAIVGSGPAGLSAAGHAAELGVVHVLLESSTAHANTLQKYQKGKHVMAEPAMLPLRSPMSFKEGTREEILGHWESELQKYSVNIRYGATVVAITGSRGAMQLKLGSGDVIEADDVVLGIGLQGNLRKLGVAGEDLPTVQYQLDDPEEYSDETIVVVGAGDAGIENALALAKQNRVIMINRIDEFTRCKDANMNAILAAIKDGRMECRYGTMAEKVEATKGPFPATFVAQTPQGVEAIPCHRVIARLGAMPPRALVESFGIEFPNKDVSAVPRLSERYESNVPGIFIVGALGGCPLIKQAMNQGYEVVEHILGNPVEPADEDLLRAKFKAMPGIASVSDGLNLIQQNVRLFEGLTTLQLREFLLDSTILTPASGTKIFERNDYTNSFFSIVEGQVVVHSTGKDGGRVEVPLGAGEFFGEMGLISGRRRSATIEAAAGCVLIETPRRSMLKLLASVDSVRRELDEVSLKRAVRSYLATGISSTDLDFLVEGAKIRRFVAGEAIFTEGDRADGLHLIRRGSVTVSREIGGRDLVMSYVAAGNYVGEMALLSERPRSATVRAAVATETIFLEAARFTEVVARNSTMRAELDLRFMDRLRANEAMNEHTESGSLISFLMKQGLGEATDVLLIDESLCIRCNNCEKACAD